MRRGRRARDAAGDGEVADLLAGAVDPPGPPDHADGREDVGNRGEEAHRHIGEAAGLDDLRQEDADAIGAEREAELDQRARMRTRGSAIAEARLDFGRSRGCSASSIALRMSRSFGDSHSASSGRSASTRSTTKPRTTAGQSLDDEQPLPALEAEYAVELQQQPGDRAADHGRDRYGDEEPGQHAGAVLGRKPRCQIIGDAGKEPGFSDAEQEPQRNNSLGPDDQGRGADTMPQVIMMRAIQRRAPNR